MKRVVRIRTAQEKEKTCGIASVSLKRAESWRKGRKENKEETPGKFRNWARSLKTWGGGGGGGWW